ncbi:unnamed protein product, partial [marine sediment metagenome]
KSTYIDSNRLNTKTRNFVALNQVTSLIDFSLYSVFADVSELIPDDKKAEFEQIIENHLFVDRSATGCKNNAGELIDYVEFFP